MEKVKERTKSVEDAKMSVWGKIWWFLTSKEATIKLITFLVPEQLKEKVVSSLIVHGLVITIKVIVGLLGLTQLVYIVGYIILHGLYFGGTASSLLDLSINYVPFSYISCLIAGLFILGIAAYYAVWYLLWKEKKITILSTLLGIFSFWIGTNVSLIILNISALNTINISIFLALLFIWLNIFALALLILISYYGVNYISKHYREFFASSALSVIFSYLLKYLVIENYKYLNKYLTYPILLMTIGVIIFTVLKFFKIEKLLDFSAKSKEPPKGKNPEDFTILDCVKFTLIIISMVIILFLPISAAITYTIGNGIGEGLKLTRLITYEQILIDDKEINGRIVAKEGNTYYISDLNRNLRIISSDDTITRNIISSAEINLQGKSKNWDGKIHYNFKDKKIEYTGELKYIGSNSPINVSYQFNYSANKLPLLSKEKPKASKRITIRGESHPDIAMKGSDIENIRNKKNKVSITITWTENKQTQKETISLTPANNTEL